MATKKRSVRRTTTKLDAKAVKSTAYEVWLAGLGALVVAQREGRKQYASLVKQGQALEKRVRKLAATPMSERTRTVVDAAQEMTGRAQATLQGVQKAMADQVGRAVSGLSVAKAPDFGQVQKRVEEMMANMQSLAKLPKQWTAAMPWAAKPAKVTRKRATKKVAKKKAAKK